MAEDERNNLLTHEDRKSIIQFKTKNLSTEQSQDWNEKEEQDLFLDQDLYPEKYMED